MIMIDVMVPPIDESFDFEVDEKTMLSDLRKEIEDLISAKKKLVFGTELRELFSFRKGGFLKGNMSLQDHGLQNGDRLILI